MELVVLSKLCAIGHILKQLQIWCMANNMLGTSNICFISVTFYVLLFYLNLNFIVKNRYMLLIILLSEQNDIIRDWI